MPIVPLYTCSCVAPKSEKLQSRALSDTDICHPSPTPQKFHRKPLLLTSTGSEHPIPPQNRFRQPVSPPQLSHTYRTFTTAHNSRGNVPRMIIASSVLTCEKSSIAGRERQQYSRPSARTLTPMMSRIHHASRRLISDDNLGLHSPTPVAAAALPGEGFDPELCRPPSAPTTSLPLPTSSRRRDSRKNLCSTMVRRVSGTDVTNPGKRGMDARR